MAKKKRRDLNGAPEKQTLLDRKLKEFEKEGKTEEYRKRQTEKVRKQYDQQQLTQTDRELGIKYCEKIEKGKQANPGKKCYFSMDYLEGIPFPKEPKLIYFYGAKNIGKTHSLGTFFTRELDENPTHQIMMIRTTKEEVIKGLAAQLDDSDVGPFTLVKSSMLLKRKPGFLKNRGESQGKYLKRSKRDKEEDENSEIPERALSNTTEVCGFATYSTATGFRSFQGSGGKNVKYIVGDEFNDVGNAKEGLSTETFKKFLVFVLSIERNNKDLKILLFGNLLRHDSGVASNVALDAFGIPYDANLKYGEFPNGTPAVYINLGAAGDLFDSVEGQAFTDMFGREMSQDLYSNLPQPLSLKVLNTSIFVRSEPKFALIVEHEDIYWVMYVGSLKNRAGDTYYIMHIEAFSPFSHGPGYKLITDSVEIYNQYGTLIYKRSKKVARMIKRLRKLQKGQRLFFSRDDVRQLYCITLSKKLVIKYAKELDGDI